LILQNSIENKSSLKYGMESKFLIIAAQYSFIEGKNSVILLTGEIIVKSEDIAFSGEGLAFSYKGRLRRVFPRPSHWKEYTFPEKGQLAMSA